MLHFLVTCYLPWYWLILGRKFCLMMSRKVQTQCKGCLWSALSYFLSRTLFLVLIIQKMTHWVFGAYFPRLQIIMIVKIFYLYETKMIYNVKRSMIKMAGGDMYWSFLVNHWHYIIMIQLLNILVFCDEAIGQSFSC